MKDESGIGRNIILPINFLDHFVKLLVLVTTHTHLLPCAHARTAGDYVELADITHFYYILW